MGSESSQADIENDINHIQSTKTCPNEHILSTFEAPHPSFVCDRCKKQCVKNEILFGCRKCNYDLCVLCYFNQHNSAKVPKYDFCSAALYHQNEEKSNDDDDEKKWYTDETAARLFYEKKKLWTNGKTLKVYFMSGQADIQQKVLKIAQKWSKYCNIKFVETKSKNDSDIRIGFDTNQGSWSYVGTTALDIDKNKQTMNFGWFDRIDYPDHHEYNTTTLHEFGHSLGFKHEHLHPIDNVPYDKAKVYDYYKKNGNWDKDKVDRNVLNRADPIRVCGFDEGIDKESIMLYTINPGLLVANHDARFDKMTTRNHKLSLIDKCKAYRFYPFGYPAIGTEVEILSKKEVQQSFKIATRGSYDCAVYDKYCNKTGFVTQHHPTNGIQVRFRHISLWYEPISIRWMPTQIAMMPNDDDNFMNIIPPISIEVKRFFVGDHVRVINEESHYYGHEGIIQIHDTDTFAANFVTIAIKPYEDILVRLSPKDIRKLESHEVHNKEKSNKVYDCHCRAMLITSAERKVDGDIMKKHLTKDGFIMVTEQETVIFHKNNTDLNKAKLLNAMATMFDDKKRNCFILYYSGPSDGSGDWNFEGEYDQFCISIRDIVTVWRQRKYCDYYHFDKQKKIGKSLLIISDCDYSGKWVEYLMNIDQCNSVKIQASCRKNEQCDDGEFTKRYAPECLVVKERKWSAGKWVTYIPKAVGRTARFIGYHLPKQAYNAMYSFEPCTGDQTGIGGVQMYSISYSSTHEVQLGMVNSWFGL